MAVSQPNVAIVDLMRRHAQVYMHMADLEDGKFFETPQAFKDIPAPSADVLAIMERVDIFSKRDWDEVKTTLLNGGRNDLLNPLIFCRAFGLDPLTCSEEDVYKAFNAFMKAQTKKSKINTTAGHWRNMFRAIGRRHAYGDGDNIPLTQQNNAHAVFANTGNPMTSTIEKRLKAEQRQ